MIFKISLHLGSATMPGKEIMRDKKNANLTKKEMTKTIPKWYKSSIVQVHFQENNPVQVSF